MQLKLRLPLPALLMLELVLIMNFNVHSSAAQSWQNCQTPKRTQGRCVPPTDCEYVVQVQTNYGNRIPAVWQNFLMQSRCYGNDGQQNFICCDLKQIRTSTQTIAPPPSTTTPPPPPPPTPTRPSQPMRGSTGNNIATDSAIIFTSSDGDFASTLNRNAVNRLHSFTCGVSNVNRISFGNRTKLAEFPWVALLRYDSPHQPFQCGGSLVSQRYVITAAHCLTDTNYQLIGVRLGEHDITQEEDCKQQRKKRICYRAEDFDIESTTTHPNYNRYRYVNDIGLIRLNRDVVFKEHISPICLPVTNIAAQLQQYPDKYIIAGWGTTETGETSKVMLKAELLPQTRSHCQNIFRRIRVDTVHICAGGDDRVDSCKGDSGGPLFATTQYELTARYVLYGVVSFGVAKCGDENSYPGVYVNVVAFMPWITNNILD